MFDQITVAYITALFLICMGYVAGYLVGRLDIIYNALRGVCRAVQGSDRGHAATELGKTTAVQDDIGSSVSKLSQLKGK